MRLFALLILLTTAMPLAAQAGQAEAKDLARGYNCTVSGIKLVGQETGTDGASLYEVTCALPAEATEDNKKANGTLTIACNSGLCSLRKKGS